jgi:hypothetical protein
MAAQAPWRTTGAQRRACDIREHHDAVANHPDPTVRAFRRDQLRRNGAIAAEADNRQTPGEAALRQAMAASDDDEAIFHGPTKWGE